MLLHMYIFSCPFGFTYAAFFTTVLFELHLMLFFLNAFEIPAYASGNISAFRPRYFYTAGTTAGPTVLASTATSVTSVTAAAATDVTPSTTGMAPPVPSPSPSPSPSGLIAATQHLSPRRPGREASGASVTRHDSSTCSSTTLADTHTNNDSHAEVGAGGGAGMQREMSFSTPLEEIIAYEHAIRRQQRHLQSQEESTEFAYSLVGSGMVRNASSRTTSVSSVTGTMTAALSAHRQSLHSDLEGFGERDIGLALFGSDSGEMSEAGFSRSSSVADIQATSSSPELKNVSRALQFELSKQIQNQQMAAMMVYDLPAAPSFPSSSTHPLSRQHQHQPSPDTESAAEDGRPLHDVDHEGGRSSGSTTNSDDNGAGEACEEATLAPKRSSVFSLLSNLKWGKSKGSADNNTSSTSSSSSSLRVSTDPNTKQNTKPSGGNNIHLHPPSAAGGDERRLPPNAPELSLVHAMEEPSCLRPRLPSSSSSSVVHALVSVPASTPPPPCISLSSPLANSALESLQLSPSRQTQTQTQTQTQRDRAHELSPPQARPPVLSIGTSSSRDGGGTLLHSSSRSPLSVLRADDVSPSEIEYIRENEGFSIFGTVYDDDSFSSD
jgi:hypothetical protein